MYSITSVYIGVVQDLYPHTFENQITTLGISVMQTPMVYRGEENALIVRCPVI